VEPARVAGIGRTEGILERDQCDQEQATNDGHRFFGHEGDILQSIRQREPLNQKEIEEL